VLVRRVPNSILSKCSVPTYACHVRQPIRTDYNSKRGVRGNVTIIVTFALGTMFGLLGLVFDVGYGYYVKQVAQGAADAGALASVAAAQAAVSGSIACGPTVLCQDSSTCPAVPTTSTDFG